MPADDPPTEAELAFLQLQRQPRAFARWAAEARERWALAHPEVPKPERKAGGRKTATKTKPLPKWGGIDESD